MTKYVASVFTVRILRNTLIIFFTGIVLSSLAYGEVESTANTNVFGDPLLEPAKEAFSRPGAAAIQTNRIRVGFYNIEMFTDGIKDGKNRTEALALNQAKGAATIVGELNADILLICEIENERILNHLNEALVNPYPKGYIVKFGTKSGRDEKMNIGLLSRYMPVSVDEIDFGPMTGKYKPTRGIFRVVYDLGDDRFLLLYGAHLKANWGDRDRNYAQRVKAMEIVKGDAATFLGENPGHTYEIMLMGDFNSDPLLKEFSDDPTFKVLEDWVDLFSEHPDISDLHTIATRKGDPFREFPPALFDRVLVHPNVREKPWQASLPGVIMKGTETEDITILPGSGHHISDHYPIYLDLLK